MQGEGIKINFANHEKFFTFVAHAVYIAAIPNKEPS